MKSGEGPILHAADQGQPVTGAALGRPILERNGLRDAPRATVFDLLGFGQIEVDF